MAPGVTLTPTAIEVAAGEPEKRIQIGIRNVGAQDAEYELAVSGLQAGWYRMTERLQVRGGGSGNAEFWVRSPASAPESSHHFTLRVSVAETPEVFSEAVGELRGTAAEETATPAPMPAPTPPPIAGTPDEVPVPRNRKRMPQRRRTAPTIRSPQPSRTRRIHSLTSTPRERSAPFAPDIHHSVLAPGARSRLMPSLSPLRAKARIAVVWRSYQISEPSRTQTRRPRHISTRPSI